MTNFEKLTKDPETLADFINRATAHCADGDCEGCALERVAGLCGYEDILGYLKEEVVEEKQKPKYGVIIFNESNPEQTRYYRDYLTHILEKHGES